jgi:exo-1,4-beta-D-glucosaminidase
MQLPESSQIFGASNPVFLRLTLLDAGSGLEVQRNLYWLSAEPDVLDWNASNFYRTPCSAYTNYSGLCDLPTATVTTSIQSVTTQGADAVVSVTVENVGSSVAFFVRLRLTAANAGPSDRDVLPVLWSDNYVTLFEGESTVVTATVPTVDMPSHVVVITEVFNNIVTCA